MTHRLFLALAAFALLVPLPASAQGRAVSLGPEVREHVAVDAGVVALTNVKLIDGTGAAPQTAQTVVLRDGRIAEVGPAASVSVPAGAEVLDLGGHTVIPGIVGMHDHTFYTTAGRVVQLSYSAPRLYLGSGVTTVRTTGSYHPYTEINTRRAIEAGEAIGPRMHITGPYLTGTGSSRSDLTMTQVGTPEDARRTVAYWAEEGVDWFKAYTRITRAELKAAIDEAHRHGKKFTGHLCSVSFREAVALGIDNLEHGFLTNSDYVEGREPDACVDMTASHTRVDLDGPEVTATIRDMVDADVAMTSTLAVMELFVPGRPPLEQRVLDLMSPATRAEYLEVRDAIAGQAGGGVSEALFRKAMAFERKFVDAGGLLAAGVDPTGNGGALPGLGDQRNYELLIEAGFTPAQVVRIMTLNGARILEVDGQLGSVEAGKLADLVVIRGDLAEDPAAIRNVTLVFKDGVGYDSPRLMESVEGQVGIR